jgi:very-short-patch-repair endonuclease
MLEAASVLVRLGHVAHLEQLRAGGCSDRALRAAVTAGEIRRLRPGWYATWTADIDQVRAVTLGGSIGCVSALGRYGVWSGRDARLHVRVDPNSSRLRFQGERTATGSSSIVYRSRRKLEMPLASEERPLIHWRHGGAPAPTRAWIDDPASALAAALQCQDDEHAIACIDSALHERVLPVDHVARIVARSCGPARRLFALRNPGAESGGESIFSTRMRRLGYRIERQFELAGVGRFDALIEGCVLFEFDGFRYHRSRTQYRNDRDRTLAAQSYGLPTVRITPELLFDHWASTLAAVDRVIEDARRLRSLRGGQLPS